MSEESAYLIYPCSPKATKEESFVPDPTSPGTGIPESARASKSETEIMAL
jgi:hypothetical protein